MFSFRNPVPVTNKTPKNKFVLTLTKMEGDADHYYHEDISFNGLNGIPEKDMINEIQSEKLVEVVKILKALQNGANIKDLQRDPNSIGVSQERIDQISDMVGYDDCGNRHKITEAVMTYYDFFGNKFKGEFYMNEEKIFPMNIW